MHPVEPAAVRGRCDRLPQTGRVVLAGPEARAQGRLPLPGLVQDRARLGVPVHRGHRAPAHRVGRPGRRDAHRARDPDGADDHAGEERAAPPARRRARGESGTAVRFDAGYSAAALTDGLRRLPVHVLVRLATGSVFYADPVTWEGRPGRPARRGAAVHCLEPADFTADTGHGPRGRGKPLPPNPEPDEELTLPDTPLYGTVRAGAWHRVHPLLHGDRGWFAGRKELPVLPGTLIHVTVERLPNGRDPHRAMWLWHAGPGRCPWMNCGAPTSQGSTSSTPSRSSRAPSA